MSIIKVKNIPKPKHTPPKNPFNYKDKLERDIQRAYVKGIEKFEFIGYPNPDYVSTYARNLAYRLIRDVVYLPAKRSVKDKLIKEFTPKLHEATKFIKVDIPTTAEPAIKIHGVTVRDVKRVYGEIDYEYINNFEKDLLKKCKAYYSSIEVQEELKRRLRLEKE